VNITLSCRQKLSEGYNKPEEKYGKERKIAAALNERIQGGNGIAGRET
jgi:hypothetical protein